MLRVAAALAVLAVSASADDLTDAAAKAAESARKAQAARPQVVSDPHAKGAWFRKVVGPAGGYDGIEAWGVLPKPSFDHERDHRLAPGEPDYMSGPLDRPDIYVGLSGPGVEVDAGLTWDHVHGPDGPTGKMAYRVYWRTKGGGWKNPVAGAPNDLYLRPGDRFALTLRANLDGTVRLAVRRAGKRGAAEAYEFPVPGLVEGGKLKPVAFKRVHALDQFYEDGGRRKGNEGRDAARTKTTLTGGAWEGTHLLNGEERTALSGALVTVVRGPDGADAYGTIFPSAGVGPGGSEEIAVLPPKP